MTFRRLSSQAGLQWRVRRIVRELTICVALPAVLLVSAEMVAQKTDTTQAGSDQQVAEAVNSKLQSSKFAHAITFNVWVHDGTVKLSGNIASADDKKQVDALIRSVPGVKTVEDQLTIGPAPGGSQPQAGENGAGPQSYSKPDQQVQGPVQPGEEHPGEAHPSVPPPPPPTNEEQQYQGANGANSAAPGNPGNNGPYSGAPGVPPSQGPPPPGMANNSGPAYEQPMVTVPVGTPLYVLMLRPFGSRHTKPGERFQGVLIQNVLLQNGAIAIPRGATLDGTVIDARGPGHLKGRPHLALQLFHVEMADTTYPLSSSIWSREGPGKGGQTAGNVVGGAAVGTVVGGVVGGGPSALLGGVLGGLGGAGLSALSRGPGLYIPAESVLTFYINAPLTVREPTRGEIQAAESRVPPRYQYQPPHPNYPYGGYPPPPGPPGGYPY